MTTSRMNWTVDSLLFADRSCRTLLAGAGAEYAGTMVRLLKVEDSIVGNVGSGIISDDAD